MSSSTAPQATGSKKKRKDQRNTKTTHPETINAITKTTLPFDYKYRHLFPALPPPDPSSSKHREGKRAKRRLKTEQNLGANRSDRMAQLSRVWVAATVAAVRAQRERAPAGARDRLAGIAPQAAALGAARAAADDGRRQAGADESLRKAMYLSCWGPS